MIIGEIDKTDINTHIIEAERISNDLTKKQTTYKANIYTYMQNVANAYNYLKTQYDRLNLRYTLYSNMLDILVRPLTEKFNSYWAAKEAYESARDTYNTAVNEQKTPEELEALKDDMDTKESDMNNKKAAYKTAYDAFIKQYPTIPYIPVPALP